MLIILKVLAKLLNNNFRELINFSLKICINASFKTGIYLLYFKKKMKENKNTTHTINIFFILTFTSLFGYSQVNPPSNIHFLCESPYTNFTVYWDDNSTNETGFIIEAKTDDSSWVTWQTLNNANRTSYGVLDYDRTESREFRVIAFNSTENSTPSETLRVVGTSSDLEVYPEVPGIRSPQMLTIGGITFPEIQYQCPAEPDKGHATRISTFYNVQVRPSAGGDWLNSPTYEVRPQIRDNKAQNNPAHSSGGHDVYAYGKYGPSTSSPNRTLHSRHWNNFDAETEITVRIELLSGALSQTIDLNQLEVYPAPINISLVNSSTVDITLPAAGNDGSLEYSKHYMIAFNRNSWKDPVRHQNIFEHPLMLFVNPVKPAPASSPANTYKEFNGGTLIAVGAGIHLPNNYLRFFGAGGNNTAREVYIPGDAYMHGGFALNNTSHPIKVWGRGIYSDELFLVHATNDNNPNRTPWANVRPAEGNPWNLNGTWEASIFFKGNASTPQTVEGLSSISRRMGSATKWQGNGRLIDHKDIGYGGGLYQEGNTKSYFLGNYVSNDDDIIYVNQDYEMRYCTTRNSHNGPSFQFGWGINDNIDNKGRIYNHMTLPSDKLENGYGQNHGVFNSRQQSGNTYRHFGGYFEDVYVTGRENIVFNIGLSNEDNRINDNNPVSVFGDKTFKNVTIEQHSRNDNYLETKVKSGESWESYMRFIHFDNLVIEGNLVENIDDGDYFDYNEKINDVNNMNGVLLHTVTFFSLPDPITEPSGSTSAIGQTIVFGSKSTENIVIADSSLPVSLSPLCANSDDSSYTGFQVIDAGNGYIALRAPNGYLVKADPERYGYVYTEPDLLREDDNTTAVTENAKFIWEDLGNDEFALYSKTLGLYVRAESNTGPNNPLYAASASIGDAETFSTNLSALSVNELSYNALYFHPNPVKNTLYVKNLNGEFSFSIYDVSGKLIRKSNNVLSPEINMSNLNRGLYFIEITNSDNFKSVTKIIKE